MSFPGSLFAPPRGQQITEPVALPKTSTTVIGSVQSGKTSTLISFVKSLEMVGFGTQDILVLTPTRVAAAQLRDQIALNSELAAVSPRAQSITSFAFRAISDSGLKLLSGAGQEQLIRQLVDENRNQWPLWGLSPDVARLRGFVQELRDIFSVLIENELEVENIAELAAKFPKLDVKAVIGLYPQYLDSLSERSLVDPAQLPLLALQAKLEIPKALLVDDAQNLSLGQLRLVDRILGSDFTFLFGDPDAAVLGFRNSSGSQFIELSRRHGFAEQVLTPGPNQSDSTRVMMAKIVQRIPVGLAAGHRPKPMDTQLPEALLFGSTAEESDYLAAFLRQERIAKNLEWDQMAVVGRTRNQLEQLAGELAARQVPTRIQGVQRALRDQPMARALIDFVLLALSGPEEIDLMQFLESPLCGFNSLELRQLLRQIRMESSLSAQQGLRQLVTSEAEFEAPRQLKKLLSALDKLRGLEEPTCHQAVSIGFELAAESLTTLAKGTGATALAANRSLDSALELFAAAQRFDDKKLGGALEFARQQLQIAIPEDSLAPVGLRPAVQLVTPSSIHGSFEVLAIPRLQEGIWPNLNPRHSLLGASSLQSYLSGRLADPTKPDRSELADELRFFYRSLGAANGALLLSAMQDEQEQPSQFFQVLGLQLRPITEPVSFDLRQLVGRLRRSLAAGDNSAANQLAALALAKIPGAHPRYWHGLIEPSSQAIDQVSSLAASRIEEFERCPLHWFIRSFGGDAAGFSASLGTLLHAALEQAEQGIEPQDFVSDNFHTLEFESQWQKTRAERTAAQLALLISNYLVTAAPAVASEQSFALQFGSLEIRGKIDRIERTDNGYEVVDLKTGKTVPSEAEVAQNRQLAIYQLAVRQLHGEVAGARLISIGSGKLRPVAQGAITPELELELSRLIESIAAQLEAGQFVAQIDDHCSDSESCMLLLGSAVTIG